MCRMLVQKQVPAKALLSFLLHWLGALSALTMSYQTLNDTISPTGFRLRARASFSQFLVMVDFTGRLACHL